MEAGLAQIPRNCRLAQDVRQAMAIARSSATAEELLDRLWQAFEHYDPVHTNNNAALCAAVLLFAGDDYEKGITTAVLGGWDTDCNGATVGSIPGREAGRPGHPRALDGAPARHALFRHPGIPPHRHPRVRAPQQGAQRPLSSDWERRMIHALQTGKRLPRRGGQRPGRGSSRG